MPKTFKVALLIETARGYGREMLQGIVRYARLHGPWAFYVTPGDFEQAVPEMKQWGGTGIIARVETPAVARAIVASGLPAVVADLTEGQRASDHPLSQYSEIASDSESAARMAAKHLLERGFRHYAFVGVPDRVWSDRRQEGFCRRIEAEGYTPRVYRQPRRKCDRQWGREQSLLADWLHTLPKPIGLMACNDDRGREVLEACRKAGVAVPEEIAVVGVDNDELLCELSDPPLSSVVLNAERGGYQAAELLHKLMTSRRKKPERILVEPLRVVVRRSTDVIALDDREVAFALQFIRDCSGQPIQVSDVVRSLELDISRRALEIRFKRAVGRSIHEEIERVQLERAKRLLAETDMRTAEVATASGFGTASYLAWMFRQRLGMTPSQYRVNVRCQ